MIRAWTAPPLLALLAAPAASGREVPAVGREAPAVMACLALAACLPIPGVLSAAHKQSHTSTQAQTHAHSCTLTHSYTHKYKHTHTSTHPLTGAHRPLGLPSPPFCVLQDVQGVVVTLGVSWRLEWWMSRSSTAAWCLLLATLGIVLFVFFLWGVGVFFLASGCFMCVFFGVLQVLGPQQEVDRGTDSDRTPHTPLQLSAQAVVMPGVVPPLYFHRHHAFSLCVPSFVG
jgi:hypothetical protein